MTEGRVMEALQCSCFLLSFPGYPCPQIHAVGISHRGGGSGSRSPEKSHFLLAQALRRHSGAPLCVLICHALSQRVPWPSHPRICISLSIPRSLIPHMSYTHPTSTSSSNFQLIFNNALEAYKRRTKIDPLAHPLAVQLQACDSTGSVLSVLQQQVPQLDQSQRSNERLIRWLDPTVRVLYSLSATLERDFGLVCLRS